MNLKNLDDLLDENKVRDLFDKHRTECGLGHNFKIEKFDRHLVLSPKTYAMRYEINDGGLTKILRLSASSEETRVRAFEIMKILEDSFSGPIFFIPKVFFYDPYYNSIAYENITGNLLIDDLGGTDIGDKISLSAQWLNHLHGINKKPSKGLPNHNVVFNFEALGKFYPNLAQKAPDIVNDIKKELSHEENLIIHGDYQPNNIIVSDNKITVIDFNDSQLGHPSLDVAKFLTQLKVMLTRFADVGIYPQLEEIFLKNYELELNQKNLALYKKFYYLQILSALAAILEKDSENKSTIPAVYKYWEESNVA